MESECLGSASDSGAFWHHPHFGKPRSVFSLLKPCKDFCFRRVAQLEHVNPMTIRLLICYTLLHGSRMSIFSLNCLFDVLLWVETVFSVVLHGGKGGCSMSYSKEAFLMFKVLL